MHINSNLVTNIRAITNLCNTLDKFHEFVVLERAVENNYGVVNLNVLAEQLERSALLVADINSYNAGGDLKTSYDSILFVFSFVTAFRDHDRDKINTLTDQLRDNNPDVIGEISNPFCEDERNALIDALNKFYSPS
jgi:hypothetical protein